MRHLPLLLALCAGLAYGQAPASKPTPPASKPIPDDVLYRMFFRDILTREKFADQAKGKGKSDKQLRNYVQTKMGLSNQETALVKSVAASCMSTSEASAKATDAEVRTINAQRNSKGQLPVQASARAQAIRQQQVAILTDCTTQIRNGMGEGRFKVLDQTIRTTIGGRILALKNSKSKNPFPTGGTK